MDAERKIYAAVTGLSLGFREVWLRWLTVESAVVLTPLELAEQAEQLVALYRRRFGALEGGKDQEQ